MVRRIRLPARQSGPFSAFDRPRPSWHQELRDAVDELEPDGAIFVTREGYTAQQVHSLERRLRRELARAGVIVIADKTRHGAWLYRPHAGATGLALRLVGPDKELEIMQRPIED